MIIMLLHQHMHTENNNLALKGEQSAVFLIKRHPAYEIVRV